MAENIRRAIDDNQISPGPYLAKVVNHLDPTYMGGLEVTIIKAMPGSAKTETQNVIVKYCSPFFGATSQQFEGNNSADFQHVQKSYGFWAVPPDIGTTVMVMFVEGDINQGYWFGCVPDMYQNHMVPGLASSQYSAMTDAQLRQYGTREVPVAEFHKSSRDMQVPNPDTFTKPVHPFADRLVQQGLLVDNVRGVTSSSARREIPSKVFGISTPGPIDNAPGSQKAQVGFDTGQTGNSSIVTMPVSRLGGHQLVMDDGDKDGKNELFRIRTRTGHQILLHNSADLIYIANSKGTAWIELTSNGKIDVYAQDSISVHSETDFNFRADRDINMEAGRNFNVRVLGNMETNIVGYRHEIIDDYSKTAIRNDCDIMVGADYKLTIGASANIGAGTEVKISASSDMDLGAGGVMRQTGNGGFNIGSTAQVLVSGARIDLNGPGAAGAQSAQNASETPILPTYTLPNRSPAAGWADKNFYRTESIESIMQRVPTHEPWDQHENVNPDQFSASATDVTNQDRSADGLAPGAGGYSANAPAVIPGVCSAASARDIGDPRAQAGINALKAACEELKLTSPYAVASLLAIAGGETKWRLVDENFNYRPARLLEVFPSKFRGNRAMAEEYSRNPSRIAELVYGGRYGNTSPGDGAKYIGRGYIQLTFKGNYERYSRIAYQHRFVDNPMALVNNPELLTQDSQLAARVCVLYMLDRCRADPSNAGYFNAALSAVGHNVPNIAAVKRGYYNCFYSQLSK